MRALDWAKGTAVLGVLLVHFSQLSGIFENDVFISSNQYFVNLINSGARGVQLFFIVSGFALTYNFKKYKEKPLGLLSYFTSRFFRIYPLWIVTLLIYAATKQNTGDLFLSATFLFGFVRWQNPNPEIVIGGWSLFCEVAFYILLPLILRLLNESLKKATVLLIAAILLRVLWIKNAANLGISDNNSFVGLFPFSNFYCFVLGIATYFYWNKHKNKITVFIKTKLLLLIISLIIIQAIGTIDQIAGSIVMACILLQTLYLENSQTSNFRTIEVFGKYCYSIYLFQFLIIEEIPAKARILQLELGGVESLIAFTVLAMVLLGIAWLVNRYFEAPMIQIGRRTIRKLEGN